MGYFLAMTWPFWLVALVLGLLITWLIFREPRRGKHMHGAKGAGAVAAGGAVSGADGDVAGAEKTDEGLRAELAAKNDELSAKNDQLSAKNQECDRHTGDLTAAHARIAELESAIPETLASPETPEVLAAATPAAAPITEAAVPAQAGPAQAGPGQEGEAPADTAPADTTGASEVLGYKLKADDLTAVEGIGPKIRDLLHAQNIRTWRQLSQTDVPVLRSILERGGTRFRMHDPATWPRQAEMLANGEWASYKMLADRLRGDGNSSDLAGRVVQSAAVRAARAAAPVWAR